MLQQDVHQGGFADPILALQMAASFGLQDQGDRLEERLSIEMVLGLFNR